MSEPARVELLELDIDIRISHLWEEMDGIAEWDLESAAAFMRAGYGKGYTDALVEDSVGERGKLCSENGFKTP